VELLEQILYWGENIPQQPAHIAAGFSLSYGSLCHGAASIAQYLNRLSSGPKQPILIHGHKEPEMLIAFLGALLSGHAYAPVDTSLPAERVLQIKDMLGSPLVLTPADVSQIVSRAPSISAPPSSIQPGDPCYIMFTSGSTGKPKGVVVTYGNLIDFVDWMLEEQKFETKSEVFLNQAPFSFDLSVMDLYLSMVSGGTLYSITRDEIASPAQLFRSLAKSNTSIWVSTPSFAQLCTQEATFNQALLPSLKKFLFCGEMLPAGLAQELMNRFPNAAVFNTYGPTEATVATTSIQITPDIIEKYPKLPVGRAKPRTKVVVMDDSRCAVSDGQRGEIVIAGPNVALHYLGDPERSSKSFFEYEHSRAYCTGDLGYYQDGLLFCEGRRDFQIKFHGYRIELGDIEANLRLLPELKDALVLPRLKNDQVELLAAFIVKSDLATGSENEIIRTVKKKLLKNLPSYMVPQRFFFVPAFPINTNGKVDSKQLSQMLE
jgi:D-alanine--poly(phosphoribitol) ligase subunit 1